MFRRYATTATKLISVLLNRGKKLDVTRRVRGKSDDTRAAAAAAATVAVTGGGGMVTDVTCLCTALLTSHVVVIETNFIKDYDGGGRFLNNTRLHTNDEWKR